MKITIVYDNIALHDELTADWGFSCFVETGKKNILFDTGGNGKILMENLLNLDINPLSITDIIISHPDFDHIGGLSTFLNANDSAVIHVPISFRGIRYPNKVMYYDKPTQIYENIFLTGELGKREQSLAVKTAKGLVVIVGCGHPGIAEIFDVFSEFGKIYALIGGLHDFNQFEILQNIEKICPTHCTKHKDEIKSLYPEKFMEGGVGRVIKL